MLIERQVCELRMKTSAEIVVVTVPSIKPMNIEEYTAKMFEKWNTGRQIKNNSVLVILVANDRTIKIEIGYELQNAVPEIIASHIIDEVMIPEFKQGKLSKGLVLGVGSISRLIAKESGVNLARIKYTDPIPHRLLLFNLTLISLIAAAIISLIAKVRSRNAAYCRRDAAFGGFSSGFMR